jgi:hypothetical protein
MIKLASFAFRLSWGRHSSASTLEGDYFFG